MRIRIIILSVLFITTANAGAEVRPATARLQPVSKQFLEQGSGDVVSLTPWSGSFDVATGARGIAMGSALVANPYLKSSFRFNPALLAESKGLEVYYSIRPVNVAMYEEDYYSVGVVMESSVAGFALDYSRYNSDQYDAFFYPEMIYTRMESYDYTVTASAGMRVYPGLSVGVSLKYNKRGVNYISMNLDDPGGEVIWGGDLGLSYRSRGFCSAGRTEDNFRFALALRN
jgi:hypothetical protein